VHSTNCSYGCDPVSLRCNPSPSCPAPDCHKTPTGTCICT
jgi:hypothetical protein